MRTCFKKSQHHLILLSTAIAAIPSVHTATYGAEFRQNPDGYDSELTVQGAKERRNLLREPAATREVRESNDWPSESDDNGSNDGGLVRRRLARQFVTLETGKVDGLSEDSALSSRSILRGDAPQHMEENRILGRRRRKRKRQKNPEKSSKAVKSAKTAKTAKSSKSKTTKSSKSSKKSKGKGGKASKSDAALENSAPQAAPDTVSTAKGAPTQINVLNNDFDADGHELAVISATDPLSGSAVINGDGTIIYTPDPDFCGTDTFSYTVSDGNGGIDSATVTVGVTCENEAPQAAPDTASTVKGAPTQINVLDNDFDANGDELAVTSITNPESGSAVINGDYTITYTPDPDFCGTDTFSYTVSDGNGGFDSATVTVGVTCENEAPQVNPDFAFTVLNIPTEVEVLANDFDPDDGDVLTVTSVSDPQEGNAELQSDGTILYTPFLDFCGQDSFEYTAVDGRGGFGSATVTVDVSCGSTTTPTTSPTKTPTSSPTLTPTSVPTAAPQQEGPRALCFDESPSAEVGCPPVDLPAVCDKYNDFLYPPGDPREGERQANFKDCYSMCKDSFCCVHDSGSGSYSPSCSQTALNCPLWFPCYIIWWKLHDTVGPAPYFRFFSEEPFYDGVDLDYIQTDLLQDPDFEAQLFGHHFDTDDPVTAESFEDSANW